MARDDDVELERIIASSRRKQYVDNDAHFVMRCQPADLLGMLFAMDLQPGLARLQMLDAFIDLNRVKANVAANETALFTWELSWSYKWPATWNRRQRFRPMSDHARTRRRLVESS